MRTKSEGTSSNRVKKLETDLARGDCRRRRALAHRDSRALAVHEGHGDAAASERAGGADPSRSSHRCASGPTPWSRGGSSFARGSPSRTCRGCRWPSGLVATSCGPKGLAWPISRSATPVTPDHAIQDRHSLGRAYVGSCRPAAREGPPEPGRRDSDLRAGVSEKAVAGDTAAVDGASGRHQERRRRRRAALQRALRAAGRSAPHLLRSSRCCSSPARSFAIRAMAGS